MSPPPLRPRSPLHRRPLQPYIHAASQPAGRLRGDDGQREGGGEGQGAESRGPVVARLLVAESVGHTVPSAAAAATAGCMLLRPPSQQAFLTPHPTHPPAPPAAHVASEAATGGGNDARAAQHRRVFSGVGDQGWRGHGRNCSDCTAWAPPWRRPQPLPCCLYVSLHSQHASSTSHHPHRCLASCTLQAPGSWWMGRPCPSPPCSWRSTPSCAAPSWRRLPARAARRQATARCEALVPATARHASPTGGFKLNVHTQNTCGVALPGGKRRFLTFPSSLSLMPDNRVTSPLDMTCVGIPCCLVSAVRHSCPAPPVQGARAPPLLSSPRFANKIGTSK